MTTTVCREHGASTGHGVLLVSVSRVDLISRLSTRVPGTET
eukprot:CAMPEP_0118965454 /NCGR_PEP_ID=MMETSP1173-20130426/3033_1 /TAXON_ID=1034831 /ORGANISM="Rhizochromulina marina cf, Strain CCMP1243" /LENGTH=40 /DNA_ID= /DNA_START= /DNA_END= /DNA_ORIENTATION=